MRIIFGVALVLGLCGTARAQCAEVPSEAPTDATIEGALRVVTPPRRAPSHGTMGMAGRWPLEVENLTDRWLRVELDDATWGDADTRASLRRARLVYAGPGGRRHVGRAVTLPPRYRGPLAIEGRGARVRYHVTQWHEVTLRAAGHEVTVAGCGLRFRHGHRRR